MADPMTRLYVLETMDELVEVHKSLSFDLYIDDLTLAGNSDSAKQKAFSGLGKRMLDASKDARDAFKDQLGIDMLCKGPTGAVVASDTKLRRTLRRMLGV